MCVSVVFCHSVVCDLLTFGTAFLINPVENVSCQLLDTVSPRGVLFDLVLGLPL